MRRYALAALMVVGVGLAAAALAQATNEAEPNNNLLTASAAFAGSAITGSCSSGDDDYVSFSSAASRLVHIDYSMGGGISVSLFGVDGKKIRETSGYSNGELGFIAPQAGNYSVELTGCYDPTTWSLTFSDGGAWVQPPDQADVEPNDIAGMESQYYPGAGQGQLDPIFDPIDRWFIPVSTTSVVRVTLVTGNNTSVWVRGEGVTAYIHPYGAIGVILASVAPPGANITVWAGETRDSYTLGVDAGLSGETFFQGSSEVEPNGAQGNATAFEAKAQVILSGIDDALLDPTDVYVTEPSRAAIVNIAVAGDYECYYYTGCPRVTVETEGGRELGSSTAGGCCFNSSGRFLLEANRQYFFRVSSTDTSGPYNVTLTFQFAQVAPHTQLTITSAAEGNLIDVFTMNAGNHGLGARGDLSEASMGTSYGPTLHVALQNREPVPLIIEITAGTRWQPRFGGDDFLTTRTTLVSLGAGDSNSAVIFAAAASAQAPGPGPGFGVLYDLDGTAEGATAALLAATASGEFSPRAEATALWALANAWDRAPLHQQGASDAVIDEANRIFAKAKVPTPISSLSDGQVMSIVLLGGLGAASTLGGSYALVRRGRRKVAGLKPTQPPKPQ